LKGKEKKMSSELVLKTLKPISKGGAANTNTAAHTIFQSSSSSANHPTKDDEQVREICPIAIPTLENIESTSSKETRGPLLSIMKTIRDDPQKYEEYIKSRPKELSPQDEAFTKIPIEDFGKAMLMGMGFDPNKEDESPQNKVIEPYLLDGRPSLLGLGAKPKQEDAKLQQHQRKNKRQFLTIGSLGQIEGTHRFAVAIQTDGVPGLDMIRVRTPGIRAFGEDENELIEIELPRKKFVLLDSAKLSESHPGHRVIMMNDKKTAEEAVKAQEAFEKRRKMMIEEEHRAIDYWVRKGLHVLIVDEKDEENYRQKGVIIDVNEDGRSDVRLEKRPNQIIKRVKQKYLQTVVPDKPGCKIIVVEGKKRLGQIGLLVERRKHKEIARVAFSDGEEIDFNFDNVCELVET
jgi:G patch domain/KOW motif-containing protein